MLDPGHSHCFSRSPLTLEWSPRCSHTFFSMYAFFLLFFILWPSYHIFASCDYGIYAVISPLFLCLFLERLVCLILNLCHFCVISRWCYRSHHLHPGVLYKRECLLHCHLPRGHHSGHPAPAQHEESGDGGQVRFFCLFCFQRNLTP